MAKTQIKIFHIECENQLQIELFVLDITFESDFCHGQESLKPPKPRPVFGLMEKGYAKVIVSAEAVCVEQNGLFTPISIFPGASFYRVLIIYQCFLKLFNKGKSSIISKKCMTRQ